MKKLLTMSLAACMAVSMVGCGSNSAPAEKPAEKPADTQQNQTETPATSDKVELTYWSMWNEAEAQGQVISEAAKQYMKENENVTININWQGRDINKVIAAKLNAGEKIDLFDGSVNTTLPAAIDYVADLTEYYKGVYPTTGGKAYEDVVINATVDTVKVYSRDGEVNGVPYQPYVQCIFYNKDHFEKAGITELPTTWEAFVDTCDKLKTAGYAPITIDDAYMASLPGFYLARAKGGDWVVDLVKENKDEMWSDPAVLQMAEAYADLAANGYFHQNVTSNIFPAGQQDMANDGASMYVTNGSWLVNELKGVTGPDFPWGQMKFPAVPNGEGSINDLHYAGQAFYVNQASDNQEEAFKFIAYLTTGEWDGKIAEATDGIPSGIESVWPEALVDAKAIFVDAESWLPWSGGIEENGELTPTIVTGFTELIGGKITPQQFVERMIGM